ncbi:MAG: RNA polymerase sigma-54 factor [Acidobacteria bacterium]|nr:MAG: RNA polymerase sigma-54 factor [Acidobacteriota bacterium]
MSEKPGLLAYLQWQLAHCSLEEKELEIALYIAGNLNRYGFLEVTPQEIVIAMESSLDEVEYVLEVMQELDPPGIAARDVRESLLLQLERLGKEETLAAEIVCDHLSLLETKNYKELTRLTGKKKPELQRAIDFITRELTPYPGLPFAREATNYIVPDVYVIKIDGEYLIRLNDDDLPQLKLSDDYLRMLKNNKQSLPKESKSYLTEKVRNAEWFIKSLYQRQRTIYKVMESILKFQRDFFEYGPTKLKPLILRDVAEDIEMHESTISRVTSNKYVHTPQGLFELKYFFSPAIARNDGSSLAAESIKARIRTMIQKEDKRRPLSDSALATILAEQGIKIARRTVAKYREQMRILPVKHRKQLS